MITLGTNFQSQNIRLRFQGPKKSSSRSKTEKLSNPNQKMEEGRLQEADDSYMTPEDAAYEKAAQQRLTEIKDQIQQKDIEMEKALKHRQFDKHRSLEREMVKLVKIQETLQEYGGVAIRGEKAKQRQKERLEAMRLAKEIASVESHIQGELTSERTLFNPEELKKAIKGRFPFGYTIRHLQNWPESAIEKLVDNLQRLRQNGKEKKILPKFVLGNIENIIKRIQDNITSKEAKQDFVAELLQPKNDTIEQEASKPRITYDSVLEVGYREYDPESDEEIQGHSGRNRHPDLQFKTEKPMQVKASKPSKTVK
jgi:hypothetical protein